MTRGFRKLALTVGAVALFSAQAVVAAPTSHSTGVDPLVALSVFGTSQSKTAVCVSGSSATAAGTAAATAAAQNQGGNAAPCVLPVAGSSTMAPLAPASRSIGALPLLLGLGLVIGAFVAIATGGSGKGKGDLTPISPA